MAQRPDHPALRHEAQTWTYAGLHAEATRRAALLCDLGVQPGEVVAVTGAASGEMAVAALAVSMANAALLVLSTVLPPAEVADRVERSGVRLLLTETGTADAAAPALRALPHALPGTPTPAGLAAVAARQERATAEDPALLQATSGTTGGGTKIARLAHRWYTAHGPTWWERPDTVAYMARPAYFNPYLLHAALKVGATFVVAGDVHPARMEAEMTACGATDLWCVPPTVHLLVAQRQPPPPGLHLRVVRTSAAPLTPELAAAIRERYRATPAQLYASSEAGQITLTPRDAPPGSVGLPLAGVALRLIDEHGADVAAGETGEVIVRTPTMMTGYVGDPAATAKALRDGWLHTDDLAWRDAAGFVYLTGRRATQINVGGFKVSPEEIERVLLRHPAVREVAVLSAADERYGEIVRAVIVPGTHPPPPTRELRSFCRDHLAAYAVPRRWEFRAELPRSPFGKVLRHLL